MSNLSDLIPAGGGQNNTDFVADGAIASGKPVILTAAGKAAEISETTVAPSMPLGSEQTFVSEAWQQPDIKADPHNSNRWIMIWYDDAGTKHVHLKVITRSGTSWTSSSELDGDVSGTTDKYPAVAWDKSTADKILITYNNSSSDGCCKVGTLSGSAGSESVSWGTELNFTTKNIRAGFRWNYPLICLDESGNFVVVYWEVGTTQLYGRVLQVDGTDVTAGGSDTTINSTGISEIFDGSQVADTTDRVLVAFRSSAGVNPTLVQELTISGTGITVGSEASGTTGTQSNGINIIPVSSAKSVIITTSTPDKYPSYQIYTRSGTSFTTYTTCVSQAASYCGATNNTGGDKLTFPVVFADNSDRNPFAITGTINAGITSISFTAATEINSTNNTAQYYLRNEQQSDAEGHFVMMYEPSAFNIGYFWLGKTGGSSTNLTATNLLGIASAAISDTETGTINTWGSRNEVQSSLTIASDYYVQADGTITTTSTSPAQLIGQAISATQINIKDYTG